MRRVPDLAHCGCDCGSAPRPKPARPGDAKTTLDYLGASPEPQLGEGTGAVSYSYRWNCGRCPSFGKRPGLFTIAWSGRIIERGTISPQSGGYSATFQYERFNNLERIQIAGGSFVRKVGGTWVRADGWSAAGPAASPDQVSMLNDLMAMTVVAWDKGLGPDPAKPVEAPKEESAFKVAYSKLAPGSEDQLFAFHKVGCNLQLERFSGPVGSGKDQVHLTLDYAYPAATAAGAANPNTPSSVIVKTPSRPKSKSTRKTASARKSVQPQ